MIRRLAGSPAGADALRGQSAPPALTALVNDFANVISPVREADLESLSRKLQVATDDVMIVATIRTFEPFADLRSYAIEMFKNHGEGIGQKGRDNGLLLVLAVDDRQVRAVVGYGLERIISDDVADQTIRETMVPYFSKGDYDGGVVSGATRFAQQIAQARGITLDGVHSALGAESDASLIPPSLRGTGGVPFQWVDIPAGAFQMGCAPGDLNCVPGEQPRHRQTVAAFRMLATEVTVAMYQAHASASGGSLPDQTGAAVADNPVVNVNWSEADSFCKWAGGRLPTEVEWELRGRAGTSTVYYWGDAFDGSRVNNSPSANIGVVGNAAHKNAFGLYDMLGNVEEWTSTIDWPYPYRASDGRENRYALSNREVRGGGFNADPRLLRASARSAPHPDVTMPFIGFRCAADSK